MTKPRVLIVMPLFNASRWVERAIVSIQRQTFENFRLLVVDDGSTDDSAEIARRLAASDPRLKVWSQVNSGPGTTMNRALEFALEEGFPLLARMDADDISEPERLRLQVDRLSGEEELAACGANAHYIGEEDEAIIGSSTVPLAPRRVARELRWGLRGIIQGTTLFRSAALARVGGYRPAFLLAEEVDLFLRLADQSPLANLSEYLYRIRLHASSLSLSNLERNHRFAAYAIDCAARRRAGRPEIGFEDFDRGLSWRGRLALARERAVLGLWRSSRASSNAASLMMATLLDPKRAFARALRAAERRGLLRDR